MRNPSHRKDSFNIETENMKFTEFIKCYEGLSADCYAKFNNSYNEEYEKYREMMTHKDFILNKFRDINDVSDQFFLIYEISINLFFFQIQVIRKCQSEKYGDIKMKDYFENESENLRKLSVSHQN
jgi:hypothetical protein